MSTPNTNRSEDTHIQDDLNKALGAACDHFFQWIEKGTHPTQGGNLRSDNSLSSHRDFIFALLFVKYISDVWQDHYENYQKAYGDEPELIAELMKNEHFKLPRKASFIYLYKERHEPGNGARIDKALRAIEVANGSKLKELDKSIFQDIRFNSDQLGDEKQKNIILRDLLEDFAEEEMDLRPSRLSHADTNVDTNVDTTDNENIMGNACEYLIKRFASTGGQNGDEFYTPAEISDLIAEILAPQPGDSICDPTCGSASLLLACAHKIRNSYQSKHYALYGQEANASTWSLAKINLFLHGENNHRIEWGDTLRNPKLVDQQNQLMPFDLVVAHPPFSLDKWGHAQAEIDPFNRFERGIPPKTKGDYAFILHMLKSLDPQTGRMAVVVPHGVLFRGAAEKKIRRQLIKDNLLDTVIGLPEKLFYHSPIPAVILVFKTQKTDQNVLFIDASQAFKTGKNQNQLEAKHINKIVTTYQIRQSLDKYAYLADMAEISANDFNLNISRYVNTFEEEDAIDLRAVWEERKNLKAKWEVLEGEMDRCLEELGYDESRTI